MRHKHPVWSVMVLALLGLAACASPDHVDKFVLGGATDANIAVHAERAPEISNSAEVYGESGERAGEAVRRLRERSGDAG